MKSLIKTNVIIFTILFVTFISGCTGNPFGGDNISAGRRQISGRVVLNDGASPEGVYVWQKGYNIITQTDQDGNFKILLPQQPRQVGSTGTVERDTLYFYLANYLLETANVMILQGEFYYDRGDVDKEGKLRRPIVLQRFLRISTRVIPPFVSISEPDSLIVVKTKLQADIGCAMVGIPKINVVVDRQSDFRPLGAVIVKNLNSDDIYYVQSDSIANRSYIEQVCSNIVTLELEFSYFHHRFPPGEYEVVPYLYIDPDKDTVPNQLLEIVSRPFGAFNSKYLNKPMRRQDGHFEVKN